jgi:TPR repeat protein
LGILGGVDLPVRRKREQVEPSAMTAAAAAMTYASKVVQAAHGGTDQMLSGAGLRLVGFVQELAGRDQEVGAAVTIVTADPTDPSRVDLLARVIDARAKVDSVLAERLQALVRGVQEAGEIRPSIERDLQYVAQQRLVALAVDLGMARAELETGPAVGIAGESNEETESTEAMREAEQWFRRAAEAGSHLAQFNLGALLVQRGKPEEAEQWFGKAARTSDDGLASRATEALDWIRGNLR